MSDHARVAPADDVRSRLAAMGVMLPAAPAPVGNYRRGVVRGGIACLSGQFPLREGRLLFAGLLGRDLMVAEGQAAARAAALNVLAQIDALLGGFGRLDGLLRMDGAVACVAGFADHAAVLDGASDLFVAILGERGAHARSAIGVSSLPLNAPVELVVTAAVRT